MCASQDVTHRHKQWAPRFTASDFEVWWSRHNGWVALYIGQITVDGRKYVKPGLDAHVSLMYVKVDEVGEMMHLVEKRVQESNIAARKIKEMTFVLLPPHELSGPHYAWDDVNVHCQAHSDLHRLAHIVHRGCNRVALKRLNFHISCRSSPPWPRSSSEA